MVLELPSFLLLVTSSTDNSLQWAAFSEHPISLHDSGRRVLRVLWGLEILKAFLFIYLRMHFIMWYVWVVCGLWREHEFTCICLHQEKTYWGQFSPPTMWALRMELKLFGLETNAITHWAISSTPLQCRMLFSWLQVSQFVHFQVKGSLGGFPVLILAVMDNILELLCRQLLRVWQKNLVTTFYSFLWGSKPAFLSAFLPSSNASQCLGYLFAWRGACQHDGFGYWPVTQPYLTFSLL